MYWETFAYSAIAIAVVMLLTWIVSLVKKDVSIVDIVWGPGFVLVAWLSWALQPNRTPLQVVMITCITIWGVRLAGYLAWRKKGEGEDRRYGEMREKHGSSFPLVSLFTVFLLQGVVMWIVSLPLQFGLSSSGMKVAEGVRHALFLTAFLFWLTGFIFESVADFQLARFKQNPENKGKVFDRGLWQFTRHPNYFGDFLVWWGFGFMSLALSAELWGLLGPLVMSVFLMRISGVSLLERDLRKRKPAYAEYIERTNAFFPSPPKPTEAD